MAFCTKDKLYTFEGGLRIIGKAGFLDKTHIAHVVDMVVLVNVSSANGKRWAIEGLRHSLDGRDGNGTFEFGL